MTPQGDIFTGGEIVTDYTTQADTHLKNHKATFIHELEHVRQYQNGVNVVMRGLYRNYNWEGPNFGKLKFGQYGIEQQAQMVEDYFRTRSRFPNGPILNTFRSVIPNVK
jgi:hypothetical protein